MMLMFYARSLSALVFLILLGAHLFLRKSKYGHQLSSMQRRRLFSASSASIVLA